MKRSLIALAFALTITGCASLGASKPQTFSQRVSYAIAEDDAVIKAADLSLQNGEISSANAQQVVGQADNIRKALDLANQAYAPCVDPINGKQVDPRPVNCDITGAQSQLSSALIALTALQAYVNAQQRGK